MKVVVLGAAGMLGSMVLDTLGKAPELKLLATIRDRSFEPKRKSVLSSVERTVVDAETVKLEVLVDLLTGAEWAINCIGVIKPYLHDEDSREVQRAVRVNALFPHLLAEAAEQTGCRVLQIATDCVYMSTVRREHRSARDPEIGLMRTPGK